MSKIKVILVGKTFLFLDDIGLQRGKPATTIDLEGRTDDFIRVIGSSIGLGFLSSDTPYLDVLSHIKEDNIRAAAVASIGVDKIKAEDMVMSNTKNSKSKAKEQSKEEQKEPEEVLVEADATESEVKEVDRNLSDSALQKALTGAAKAVARKLSSLDPAPSKSDIDFLINIEESGRNRVSILESIKGLV